MRRDDFCSVALARRALAVVGVWGHAPLRDAVLQALRHHPPRMAGVIAWDSTLLP